MGLNDVPTAGDIYEVVPSEKDARVKVDLLKASRQNCRTDAQDHPGRSFQKDRRGCTQRIAPDHQSRCTGFARTDRQLAQRYE